MAIALKTKKPNRGNEAIAERPDGTRVPFLAYPTPLFDAFGTLIGAVNLLVDLGERRLMEQRLFAIIESSDDAVVSKNLDGIINTWNKGAQRLFGYEAAEIIGKPVLTLIPPHLHGEEATILARIRKGERIEHYETVRRRKDGSLVDISLTVSPLRDAQGRVVGASKIARDITERKRLQVQQALLVGEMKHRVEDTLATVPAIASQSMRHIPRSDWSAFLARLQALATAHDILTTENWNRAPVHDIVQQVILPFDPARFDIDGPKDLAAREPIADARHGDARARDQCGKVWSALDRGGAGAHSLARVRKRRRPAHCHVLAGDGRPGGGAANA